MIFQTKKEEKWRSSIEPVIGTTISHLVIFVHYKESLVYLNYLIFYTAYVLFAKGAWERGKIKIKSNINVNLFPCREQP